MGRQAIVIGGGAIGVACAHFLGRSGWETTLLERAEIASGCSYGNAGLVVPSHSHPINGPGVVREALSHMIRRDSAFSFKPRLNLELVGWLWRFWQSCTPEAAERGYAAMVALGRASMELYDDLVNQGEVDSLYRRSALLDVYLSERAVKESPAKADQLGRTGFRVQRLTRDELLSLEPCVSNAVKGGLLIEDQAYGDCRAYVRSLAAGLERRGVRVLTGRPALKILSRHGVVRGILAGSPVEELSADIVVVATGAWAPFLTARFRIPLPVQPARGYSYTVEAYSGSPALPILVEERRIAITPLGDRLRFGGTLELAGFDQRPNLVRYHALVRSGLEILGNPPTSVHKDAWFGFRPLSADGLPIIGWAPSVEGLLLATGHGMLGYTQSPITGKLVAELADGRPTSVPVESFRPDRF